jgi:hypothetical protein
MSKTFGFGLAVVLALAAGPAAAEIAVSGPFIDDQTGGDWRGRYGRCFYLIPDAFAERTRDSLGPDFFRGQQEEYRYNTCYGGSLFRLSPSQTRVDWRIYESNVDRPDVTTWAATDIVPGSAQWNPCLQSFRHTTWSNESFAADPLVVELKLSVQGALSVAYYLVNARDRCRESDFSLSIDGVEVATGTVGDFAAGKYVVFDISGLKNDPQGTLLTFKVQDAAGDAACANPEAVVVGRTTHVSGVFVDYSLASGATSCGAISGKPLQ